MNLRSSLISWTSDLNDHPNTCIKCRSDCWWWTMIRHRKAEIIHLATLNQFQDQIQGLHWRMNLTNKNMKGKYGKIGYSSWNFIQDIMFFVINYFFSFHENVKKDLQSILYLRKYPKPACDSFPLKTAHTKYLHAFDLDQDPSSESYDDHLQTDEPQETKTNSTPSVHTLYLVKFQIDTSLWFYLLYPMLSLKNMTYIYQDLMVNARASLLRDMFLISSLFLTFLKLMKKMLVLGFLLFLCKAKSRVGSKPYLM